jgi:hypothetical protein
MHVQMSFYTKILMVMSRVATLKGVWRFEKVFWLVYLTMYIIRYLLLSFDQSLQIQMVGVYLVFPTNLGFL